MHSHRNIHRYQAHRPEPTERVPPAQLLGFLLALAVVWFGLALFLATGSYPA